MTLSLLSFKVNDVRDFGTEHRHFDFKKNPKFAFVYACAVPKRRFSKRRENEQPKTRQRRVKGEIKYEAKNEYESRFLAAILAELEEEAKEFETRMKEWSPEKLENEGFALFNLIPKFDGSLYRSRILRLNGSMPGGILPPHHQFSQGDMVSIRKGDTSEDEEAVEGIVLERAQRFLRVTINRNDVSNVDMSSLLRLDLASNSLTFERCREAIIRFSSLSRAKGGAGVMEFDSRTAKNVRKFEVQQNLDARDRVREGTGWRLGSNEALKRERKLAREREKRGVQLGQSDVVAGEGLLAVWGIVFHEASAAVLAGREEEPRPPPAVPVSREVLSFAKKQPPWVCDGFRGRVKAAMGGERKLNLSQATAVESAILRRLTLWQGPPGTGKTTTLLRFIQLVQQLQLGQVLACADSNVAVDNLVEGLLALGLSVVRLGHPAKVKESLREATLEARQARHPLTRRASEMREQAIGARQKSREISSQAGRMSAAKAAVKEWESASEVASAAVTEILNSVDVIACTCVTAGDPCLLGRKFPVCVIDEATQATEPCSLIPLVSSLADCVLLVGDPCQLAPTVISKEAMKLQLDVSLYEHLQKCGVEPLLLNTQYRMHPAIAEVSSKMFYGGKVVSRPTPSDRVPPKGFRWPDPARPMVFVDVASGVEKMSGVGASLFNTLEARMVVDVVSGLLTAGDLPGGCASIGVITPYKAQARLIHDMLRSRQGADANAFDSLEISSVDGFQGREKEVIVVSLVRANKSGQLGFTDDPRRLNVMMTRAKRGLVVIGSRRTLAGNDLWRTWLRHVPS